MKKNKNKKEGLFLTLKQLKDLGVINPKTDRIYIKKRKKRKKNTKKTIKRGGLDYNQLKSNSDYMVGGGSSHQLRTPTISSEQGLLNLELTKKKIAENHLIENNDNNDLKNMVIEYQKTNDKRLMDGYNQVNNRFKNLEHRRNIMNNNERDNNDEIFNTDYADPVFEDVVEPHTPPATATSEEAKSKNKKGSRGGARAGAGRKKKVVQEPINSSIPTGLDPSDIMIPQVTRHGELNTSPMGTRMRMPQTHELFPDVNAEYEKLQQVEQEKINKLRNNPTHMTLRADHSYLRGGNARTKKDEL